MAHSLREKLHTVIEITRSSVMLFSGWARPHNASCPSARLSVCLFVSNVLSTLNHEISKKTKLLLTFFRAGVTGIPIFNSERPRSSHQTSNTSQIANQAPGGLGTDCKLGLTVFRYRQRPRRAVGHRTDGGMTALCRH